MFANRYKGTYDVAPSVRYIALQHLNKPVSVEIASHIHAKRSSASSARVRRFRFVLQNFNLHSSEHSRLFSRNMDHVGYVSSSWCNQRTHLQRRHSSKCPRRPRVVAMAADPNGKDDSVEHRENPGAKDGQKVKPPFLEYIGRQFAEKRASDASKDSQTQDTPPRDASTPWFRPWSPKEKDMDTKISRNSEDVLRSQDSADKLGNSSHSPTQDSASGSHDKKSNDAAPKLDILASLRDMFRAKKSRESSAASEQNVDENLRPDLSRNRRSIATENDDRKSARNDKGVEARAASVNSKAKGNDMWSKIADVIVPNRNNASENRLQSDVGEKTGTNEESASEPSRLSDQIEKTSQPSGIEELYKPPDGNRSNNENAKGLLAGIVAMLQGMSQRNPRTKKESREAPKSETNSLPEDDRIDNDDTLPSADISEEMGMATKNGSASNTECSRSENNEVNQDRTLTESGKELVPRENGSRVNYVQSKFSLTGTAVEISSVPQADVTAIRSIFGSETFFATETLSPPGGLIFRGNLRGEPASTLSKLEKRLQERVGDKYTLCLAEGEEDLRPVVVVVPTARDKRPPSSRQRVFSFAILALTASTCYARAVYAYWQANEFWAAFRVTRENAMKAAQGNFVSLGFTKLLLRFPVASLAVSIAFVVAASQLVQRLVARHYKTRIGLPYFVPSYQLGSFGAIVQLASPTPTRASLFDIALAGAASLFLLSLGLLLFGLRLSMPTGALMIPVPSSMLSSSLAVGWLTKLVAGGGRLRIHPGSSLVGLHPVALVGVNCLTIAALNLLPIRQLDGGRIVSAIYGRKTAIIASRVTIFFMLLASSKSSYLFVFLALVLFGPWSLDRPAKNELTEPNSFRAVLGYIFLLLMLSVLLPYPTHVSFKL